ncbi:hypothetical protein EDC94DRAFT_650468 [Helicostylum pulchrum]|nr:hypothetical protein EDC94DRAFT_650468 [Helicostylum pulchrum]
MQTDTVLLKVTTMHKDLPSMLSFKTDNCAQELIRFFTKIQTEKMLSPRNMELPEILQCRENPTVVLLVGNHTTMTQLYIIANISHFRFEAFLNQFNYRNRVHAEKEFRKLTNDILSLNIVNCTQALVDFFFFLKIRAEEFEIFRRAPSTDYQEGIANEIISSNQRTAVIGRRLEASSSSRNKKRLEDDILPVYKSITKAMVTIKFSINNAEQVQSNYALQKKFFPKATKVSLSEIRSILKVDKNNSVGVKKTIKVLRSQFDSEELFVFYVYHKVLDLKMSNSELFCISEDDKNLEDNFKNKVWRPLMTELFKDTGTVLRWRDTLMGNTDAPFRVGMRVTCCIANNYYDNGLIEFAKSFTAIKAKNDRIKPILESKEGSNVIFKILDEFRPNTQFFSLQLAGLKGNMLSTTLNDDGLYTTSNIGGGTFPGPPPRMSLGIAALQSDSFDIMDAHPVKPLDCPGCLLASRLYETFKEQIHQNNNETLSFGSVLDIDGRKKKRRRITSLKSTAVAGMLLVVLSAWLLMSWLDGWGGGFRIYVSAVNKTSYFLFF